MLAKTGLSKRCFLLNCQQSSLNLCLFFFHHSGKLHNMMLVWVHDFLLLWDQWLSKLS